MNLKLHVGNLGPNVSEAEIRALFSRAGAVTGVELMLDPASGQSRGHGFVTMATPELAAAALEAFHGYELGGRYLAVTEARPAQEVKGPMSDGFDFQPVGSFRPGSQPRKNRKQSERPARRRGRRP